MYGAYPLAGYVGVKVLTIIVEETFPHGVLNQVSGLRKKVREVFERYLSVGIRDVFYTEYWQHLPVAYALVFMDGIPKDFFLPWTDVQEKLYFILMLPPAIHQIRKVATVVFRLLGDHAPSPLAEIFNAMGHFTAVKWAMSELNDYPYLSREDDPELYRDLQRSQRMIAHLRTVLGE